MRAIIAGNPGLGIGPEWIDKSVDEIASIDFGPYCYSANQEFFLELRALFILGAKEGGGREFWLADEKPLLFALALCCHDIHWLEDLEQLRDKANRFIRKMRKDAPFWKHYPLFRASAIERSLVALLPGAPGSGVGQRHPIFELLDPPEYRFHFRNLLRRRSLTEQHAQRADSRFSRAQARGDRREVPLYSLADDSINPALP